VVVAGREGREVGQAVEGDRVVGGRVSDGGVVALDLSVGQVVRSLTTDEEAVAADVIVCMSASEGLCAAVTTKAYPRTASAVKVGPAKRSMRARVCRAGCL
jgi:hypothetical protein